MRKIASHYAEKGTRYKTASPTSTKRHRGYFFSTGARQKGRGGEKRKKTWLKREAVGGGARGMDKNKIRRKEQQRGEEI